MSDTVKPAQAGTPAPAVTPPACDACGTRTWERSEYHPYGMLCLRCWHRQDWHDHPDPD